MITLKTINYPQPPLCLTAPENTVHSGERIILFLQNGEKIIGSLRDFIVDKGITGRY